MQRTARTPVLIVLALALVPALVLAATRRPSTNLNDPGYGASTRALDAIEDGSFEAGSPNPFWGETSTNFGTPLCTIGFCGTGAGTVGPRTGDWWGWFGGIPALEVGTLFQDVTFTAGSIPTLTFYAWAGVCGDPGDTLSLSVGGNVEWSITCNDPGFTGGYAQVDVNLAAYADGGTYTVLFQGTTNTPNTTNFSLDDVSLGVIPPVEIPALDRVGLTLLVLLLAAAALALLGRR